MQGTARSTGCPTTGGPEDTASVRAVVDWLNGRAKAFYADGRAAVASWSTGNVGMLGVSYNGTLPNAAAAANIPGVKTIVPIAAISSWYEYARDQGIGYKRRESRTTRPSSPTTSSARRRRPSASRCFDKLARGRRRRVLRLHVVLEGPRLPACRRAERVARRSSSSTARPTGTSRPSHFGRWWDGLADRGVPRKIWLHRGGHLDPISFRQAEWQRVMGLWMDHWLKGVDNGIDRRTQADVQRPTAGGNSTPPGRSRAPRTRPCTSVRPPVVSGSLTTAPVVGQTQKLSDNANLSESTMMANPETGRTRVGSST